MALNYSYNCPHCSDVCSVEEGLTGQNLICPHCNKEFFASPPNNHSEVIVPEKLPFFKSGRKKILEEKLQQLSADGELSDDDSHTLNRTAIKLGLDRSDLEELTEAAFLNEFARVKQRAERSLHLTDEDLDEIRLLKKKYGVKEFTLAGNADLFRAIYLMEQKNQLPEPIESDLMLDLD